MTTFIPTESLIAYGLQIRPCISFFELRDIGGILQKMFNDLGIDTVVIRHNFQETIESHTDCFELIELYNEPYIQRKCSGQELIRRFISYLPLDIQKALGTK